MIVLEPYRVCPFGSFCEHAQDCNGRDADRSSVFICELWAENYEKHVLEELED